LPKKLKKTANLPKNLKKMQICHKIKKKQICHKIKKCKFAIKLKNANLPKNAKFKKNANLPKHQLIYFFQNKILAKILP